MNRIKKIKAGALQFVLFIGAVVAILLMAFVLLSHTHQQFDKKTDFVISVIKNAGFGLESSLGQSIPLGSSIPIKNLSADRHDANDLPIEIKVKREFWGVFEKRTATASHNNTEQIRTALVGGQSANEMPALYISDRQRPLILAGNAQVNGTAFLPEQGIKMGNIYGNSYNRDRLIYGNKKTSDSLLPKLGIEMLAQIKELTQRSFTPLGKVMRTIPVKELKNSFDSETIIIRDRTIRLRDLKLAGNIIVSASDKIIVEADSDLQDVILLAPIIVIKNWVKGNFQAIASESISVGKKCELAYPTALIVNKKEVFQSATEIETKQFVPIAPSIYIDQYAQIGGIAMVLEETRAQQYVPQIKIEENAKVNGEVYCTQNLELKGRVNGNVTIGGFIALENGSVYQNHLYNGTINSTNLSDTYVGLLMSDRNQNKKVMKWLY